MRNFIDKLINGITMYRLITYYLVGLLAVAVVLSLFGMLPFGIFALACSTLVIFVSCLLTNLLFSKIFEVPANIESAYITALILILIITPPTPFQAIGLGFLIWVSVWSMASKYMFAIGKKHIFNPAAFAVVLTALTLNQAASWWVGTFAMFPFVLVGGLLITRKIHRFDLVISFIVAAIVTILGFSFFKTNVFGTLWNVIFNTPLLFLAFVMLTEPLTTPPTKSLRIYYAILVGFLFSPAIHIGSLYSTPELALLIGNVFSYFVSPKGKYVLNFKEKVEIGSDTYNFVFAPDHKVEFEPGQYFEWTLGYDNPDDRGNRRYFTIASSPTENDVILGVRFYPNPSSYKQAMLGMKTGDKIITSQLAGDFTLPKDKTKKLVFLAGGIGITPFRSMIKCLVDTNDSRSVVLFYSNKVITEMVYKDVLNEAEKKFGLKTIYTLTDTNACPVDWKGCRGYFDAKLIEQEVPDFKERLFYISGPHTMVVSYENILINMGVKPGNIKTDFFPGF